MQPPGCTLIEVVRGFSTLVNLGLHLSAKRNQKKKSGSGTAQSLVLGARTSHPWVLFVIAQMV